MQLQNARALELNADQIDVRNRLRDEKTMR